MATPSNNTPSGVIATGLPAVPLLRRTPGRIPNRLCIEGEFLLLMDIKRRTEERLDEILEEMHPGEAHVPMSRVYGLAPRDILGRPGPKSRLKQAAPGGVRLFKGGRP